jgi:predicted glycoside hydrolase/deacetylase ChbG (UPF0249 family)
MKLILNADDFGLSKSTNEAIVELAKLGTLSSTTVMVNMPFVYDIKEIVGIEKIGIGLHFNLTQGKPLLSADKIPSLVNEQGDFFPVKLLKERIKEKEVRKEHIYMELDAQFKKLEALIGDRISHIDSHQNINKVNLVTSVLKDYSKSLNKKIALRWYNKTYLIAQHDKFYFREPSFLSIHKFGLKRALTEIYFRQKRKELKKHYFLTDAMLYAPDNSIRTLLKSIAKLKNQKLPDLTLEIMCHPAKTIEGLSDTAMLNARVEEYNILKSDKFIKFVKNVNLINYSQLS